MAACAVAMAAVCYGGAEDEHFAGVSDFLRQAALLAGIIGVSSGIYFGLAWLLRCEELTEFFLLLRRAEGAAPVDCGWTSRDTNEAAGRSDSWKARTISEGFGWHWKRMSGHF